ncbi:MAG: hypothetical protein QG662_2188 [Pseudomonadota bacterium]|jgi:hypothetical protein|nr:hypothetical protein [Pseudomonadota bacterium]
MDIIDVVLHVNETLDPEERYDLEEKMRALDGVIAPRFNDSKPHLMIIAYDPDSIQSGDLLNEVRRQGYHAQRCGA